MEARTSPVRSRLAGRFLRFLGTGAVGFLFDSAVFATALAVVRLDPLPARLIAFATAVAATWWLNRRYAFADRRSQARRGAEFRRYALSALFAGIANIGVYWTALLHLGQTGLMPYLALALGVGAGLCLNFVLFASVVFRRDPGSEADQC